MKKKIFLKLILLTLFLIGCNTSGIINELSAIMETREETSPSISENQDSNEGNVFRLENSGCIPDLSSYEIAQVTRVIDGDSIEIQLNGEIYQVRYIGINTPEYYSSDQQQARIATQANKDLVAGKTVYLFKDRSEMDKYGRLLRYVLTDQDFVNLELVRAGYAEAREYPPDTACHITFEQAAK